MDRGAVAVRDMTNAQFDDFAAELRWAVAEEAYLWELPGGSRDSLGDDTWREHGPWRREDCSAALTVWLDVGWVSLVRLWPHEVPLDTDAAREHLADPASWVSYRNGTTNVAVVATSEGDATPTHRWTAQLAELRDG
jgi:hypothetical protein